MGVACYEDYNNVVNKNKQLEQNQAILVDEINSLKRNQRELNKNINEKNILQNNMEKKIVQLENNEIELKKEVKIYKNINKNINNQLEIAKNNNRRETQVLQNQVYYAKNEVETYKRREKKLQNECADLKNNNGILQDRNNQMYNQIKDLEKQKDNLRNDINILNKKQRNLQKKNEEIEIEMKNKNIKMKTQINNLKNEKNRLTDQIDDLKNENDLNEMEKLYLQRQFNDYQNQIIEKENYIKNMKEQIIYLNNQKNLLNNKLEDLEIQNSIAENEKKEIEIYQDFLDNKINNFISKISETNEINKYVEEKCNNILKNETCKIKDKIETSIASSNFLNIIENEKDREIEKAIKDFTRESRHINVIIMGKTGVGKSELINAIAGSEIAETGGFRPMRHIGTWHEIGSLRIYDNQGIEISKYNSIDNVINHIQDVINNAKMSGQPDRFVHCIWYCVTGTRFEEDEEKAVGKLLDIYEDKSMPIIIVYLRAIIPEWIKNLKNGIDNAFYRQIEFVSVLSKDAVNEDGTTYKAKGLNNLISKTMNKVKNAFDSQSFIYVINYIQRKVQNLIANRNNNNRFIINNQNNRNNIADCIIKLFNDIIGELPEVSKKLIIENISNLQLLCGKTNFDVEIMDFMKKFLRTIDDENRYQKDNIKNSLYEKAKFDVDNKLKKLFSENLEKYINNELNSKIYDFYNKIIKNVSEIIVGNNLRNLKESIVSRMKTAIENNPNFQSLFNFSNGNNNY